LQCREERDSFGVLGDRHRQVAEHFELVDLQVDGRALRLHQRSRRLVYVLPVVAAPFVSQLGQLLVVTVERLIELGGELSRRRPARVEGVAAARAPRP
jgi:hypothetical protein